MRRVHNMEERNDKRVKNFDKISLSDSNGLTRGTWRGCSVRLKRVATVT